MYGGPDNAERDPLIVFIGQLSEQSGFSRDTIRYYEKIGLIPGDHLVRLANSYKSYSDRTLRRLSHIRDLKTAGFTLVEISHMLDSFDGSDRPCANLPTTLAHRLERLAEEISALERCRRSIQTILDACDCACTVNDGLPDCLRAR